eukprot:UN02533
MNNKPRFHYNMLRYVKLFVMLLSYQYLEFSNRYGVAPDMYNWTIYLHDWHSLLHINYFSAENKEIIISKYKHIVNNDNSDTTNAQQRGEFQTSEAGPCVAFNYLESCYYGWANDDYRKVMKDITITTVDKLIKEYINVLLKTNDINYFINAMRNGLCFTPNVDQDFDKGTEDDDKDEDEDGDDEKDGGVNYNERKYKLLGDELYNNNNDDIVRIKFNNYNDPYFGDFWHLLTRLPSPTNSDTSTRRNNEINLQCEKIMLVINARTLDEKNEIIWNNGELLFIDSLHRLSRIFYATANQRKRKQQQQNTKMKIENRKPYTS